MVVRKRLTKSDSRVPFPRYREENTIRFLALLAFSFRRKNSNLFIEPTGKIEIKTYRNKATTFTNSYPEGECRGFISWLTMMHIYIYHL